MGSGKRPLPASAAASASACVKPTSLSPLATWMRFVTEPAVVSAFMFTPSTCRDQMEASPPPSG